MKYGNRKKAKKKIYRKNKFLHNQVVKIIKLLSYKLESGASKYFRHLTGITPIEATSNS
jgi:hypothetical protein